MDRRQNATPANPSLAANAGARNNSWLLPLRAYALGPVNLVLWPNGKNRLAWSIAGAASLLGTVFLLTAWSKFLEVVARFHDGAAVGVASVAFVILLTGTTWAHAVATSAPVTHRPKVLGRPGVVCAFGLVFPGLGLLITGHRRRAALAVWCTGLLVAALAVSEHSFWRVADSAGGEGSLSIRTAEVVLAVVAGCVILGCLAWLVFALDGVRLASPVSRSGLVANRLALTLLVMLGLFIATFRPVAIARQLESRAAALRHQGLRTFPLALYETASKLDPGTPDYLARAATLYEELGLSEAAEARRLLLRGRAMQFASAIGAELVTGGPRTAVLPPEGRSPGTIDQLHPYDPWWLKPSVGQRPRAQ